MSFPPERPNPPQQPGPPPGYGPPPGNYGPRPPQGPQAPQGGYQSYGPGPQFPGQQPPGPPNQFGQQPYPPQGYQAPPPYGQQPIKSQKGLWIGIGAAGLVVVLGLILMFSGVFGGGKYVGAKVPQLPSSFGGWTKQSSSDLGGFSFGDTYKKGSSEVMAFRFESTGGEKPDPEKMPEDMQQSNTPKPRKIGTGMYCFDGPGGAGGTACVATWENGAVMFGSEQSSAAENAVKDFVKNVK